ncbi:RNA-binding S4 domain-containing protein [Paraferrimonas sedimenticola]|uniref:S4 RNA-binding domain protein n=1 Tax=Paraferrimonas sedimenticola TaxID=375674 RepID=A0AA37RXY0_9GAMM|nr:RNA-binding S4 domain-containing protein [Paraferrimonas sedimenticola]GLP96652.1 S4 RNA-binding domain protein [Paraferrimonas sedimenticola]
MQQFPLLPDQAFIELYKLLKAVDWAGSGGEAKQVIDAGWVQVNQEVETRKRKKIAAGDVVEYQHQQVRVVSADTPSE